MDVLVKKFYYDFLNQALDYAEMRRNDAEELAADYLERATNEETGEVDFTSWEYKKYDSCTKEKCAIDAAIRKLGSL